MINAIVLDTETTGLDPLEDRLVELAACSVDGPEEFSSLCDPGRGIPPEAMAVHHITEAMTRGEPQPFAATDRMLASFGYPEYIIAHNARFDKGFMEPLWPSEAYKPKWICTYRAAVMTWPDAPRHSNQVLRYWLGLNPVVPEGLAPHRALYDILVTREIFRTLLTLNPLERLLEWTERPLVLPKVTFGKHSGKPWSEVDSGYLGWCLKQPDMDPDVLHTARHWMERRNGHR